MTEVVHVWWAEPVGEDQCDGWLDRTERRRMARLTRADDRARFVTSRAMLKELVGSLADEPASNVRLDYACASCGEPHGKPSVTTPSKGSRWQVSLSHAGSRVLVAASSAGPVGVDVEVVDEVRFAGFAAVALSVAEAAAVARRPEAERDQASALAWTRKEALLKAHGTGLAVDPRTVSLAALGAEVTLVDLPVGDGYAAAVAVLTGDPVRVELAEVTDRLRGGRAAPSRTASVAAAR